jgi:hypothetical protein
MSGLAGGTGVKAEIRMARVEVSGRLRRGGLSRATLLGQNLVVEMVGAPRAEQQVADFVPEQVWAATLTLAGDEPKWS